MAREQAEGLERELGTSYTVNVDGSVTFDGAPTDEEREAAYAAAAEAAKEQERTLETERQDAIDAARAVSEAALRGETATDAGVDTGETQPTIEREGAAAQLPRERGTDV